MKFYGLPPEVILSSRTWVLQALVEEMPALQAEEQLRLARVLALFTRSPGSKREAADMSAKQKAFLRQQKALARSSSVSPDPQSLPEVDVIDPALLDFDEQERLRQWARSQGFVAE